MTANEKDRERQRRWYETNRERVIARVVAHQFANHEEYLAYQKAHREANHEEYLAKSRRWKTENADRHRASSREYSRQHKDEISTKRKTQRRELKQSVLDAYGGKCACCGESTFEFLTLDHVNGDGAEHRRSLGLAPGRSNKLYIHLREAGFPEGFRVLCFNCNSALGFYGFCPHHPEDTRGVPATRRRSPAGVA